MNLIEINEDFAICDVEDLPHSFVERHNLTYCEYDAVVDISPSGKDFTVVSSVYIGAKDYIMNFYERKQLAESIDEEMNQRVQDYEEALAYV